MQKPIRFHDLWMACEGQLSKASFVKALSFLSQRGFIIRNAKSRKHVEFCLNTHNPRVEEVLSRHEALMTQMEEIYRTYQNLIDSSTELLSLKRKIGGRRRKLIKKLVFAQASLFSMMMVLLAFAEADAATVEDESRFGRSLFMGILMRFRQIQKKGFIEILKADRKLAEEALDDWLKGQARMFDALRKVSWILPYLKPIIGVPSS